MLVFSRASLLRCSGCRNTAEMDGSYFRTRINPRPHFGMVAMESIVHRWFCLRHPLVFLAYRATSDMVSKISKIRISSLSSFWVRTSFTRTPSSKLSLGSLWLFFLGRCGTMCLLTEFVSPAHRQSSRYTSGVSAAFFVAVVAHKLVVRS